MAVIRESTNIDDAANYIASLAFFCCISCVTLMLKFGGFKATLNVFGGKRNNKEYYLSGPDVYLTGAYRTNKDEFFRDDNLSEQPKKLSSNAPTASLRPVKSSNDLAKPNVAPPNIRSSNPNVSRDPRGSEQVVVQRNPAPSRKDLKNQEKEQKKLEKQRLAQQKEREKLAAQEQAKQEKLRREREKREQQARRKEKNERKKPPAPQPLPPNPPAQAPVQYSTSSTNTLESSISRTTGPPPYSENPKTELLQNPNDIAGGNVTFSKPINETGSWDFVTQHRQQISRPATSGGAQRKQTVMDLNYNFGGNAARIDGTNNSEA